MWPPVDPGTCPAVILTGALNRFVFIKLAMGAAAIACALMAELPGRLQRHSRTLLILAAITLAVSAFLSAGTESCRGPKRTAVQRV